MMEVCLYLLVFCWSRRCFSSRILVLLCRCSVSFMWEFREIKTPGCHSHQSKISVESFEALCLISSHAVRIGKKDHLLPHLTGNSEKLSCLTMSVNSLASVSRQGHQYSHMGCYADKFSVFT